MRKKLGIALVVTVVVYLNRPRIQRKLDNMIEALGYKLFDRMARKAANNLNASAEASAATSAASHNRLGQRPTMSPPRC